VQCEGAFDAAFIKLLWIIIFIQIVYPLSTQKYTFLRLIDFEVAAPTPQSSDQEVQTSITSTVVDINSHKLQQVSQ